MHHGGAFPRHLVGRCGRRVAGRQAPSRRYVLPTYTRIVRFWTSHMMAAIVLKHYNNTLSVSCLLCWRSWNIAESHGFFSHLKDGGFIRLFFGSLFLESCSWNCPLLFFEKPLRKAQLTMCLIKYLVVYCVDRHSVSARCGTSSRRDWWIKYWIQALALANTLCMYLSVALVSSIRMASEA